MDATLALPALIGLIATALLFDFLNGLHDAANSIATIVSTRVLRPQYAVFWAAFFNFIAFLFFGLHVAQTVGTGIVGADVVDPRVIFGAVVNSCVTCRSWHKYRKEAAPRSCGAAALSLRCILPKNNTMALSC